MSRRRRKAGCPGETMKSEIIIGVFLFAVIIACAVVTNHLVPSPGIPFGGGVVP
jgi:hypothetical protein